VTWREGRDWHGVDAWDSKEASRNFGEQRRGPGMAEAGIQVQPQVAFHPAHEVYAPQPVKVTA
jgi:hypothetical protein